MGFHMSSHLSKYLNGQLFIYNRSIKKSHKWIKQNKGNLVSNLDDIDFKFHGAFICAKDDKAVLDLVIKNNLINHLDSKSFIVDHSTTSLDLIKSIKENLQFKKQQIDFFDAPVSGGEIGAINGTLSVMVGGNKSKFKSPKELIQSYASNISFIGKNGHGQIAKMINQITIAGVIDGLSEGIILGKKSEVNMNKVLEAISNGAAQSWQMDNRAKTMLKDKYDFGFAIDLMIKDLKIALNHAKNKKLNLKTTKSVLKEYINLSKNGSGDLDTSALIKKMH